MSLSEMSLSLSLSLFLSLSLYLSIYLSIYISIFVIIGMYRRLIGMYRRRIGMYNVHGQTGTSALSLVCQRFIRDDLESCIRSLSGWERLTLIEPPTIIPERKHIQHNYRVQLCIQSYISSNIEYNYTCPALSDARGAGSELIHSASARAARATNVLDTIYIYIYIYICMYIYIYIYIYTYTSYDRDIML